MMNFPHPGWLGSTGTVTETTQESSVPMSAYFVTP